jgi:hypothetical protein
MVVTFFIVTIGLILFRAESIAQAWEYACGMLQFGTLRASYRFFTLPEMRLTNLFVVMMLVVEWLQRDKQHGFEGIDKLCFLRNKYLRPIIYALLLVLILIYGGKHASFIYFQF